MSHVNHQTNISRLTVTRRQAYAPWFWFCLTGGSVLLHFVLIYLIEGSAHRSLLQYSPEAAAPIDFVELPVANSAANSAAASQATETSTATEKADLTQTAAPKLTGNPDQIAVFASPPILEERVLEEQDSAERERSPRVESRVPPVAPASPSAADPTDGSPSAPEAPFGNNTLEKQPDQTTASSAPQPEGESERQFQAIPAAIQPPNVAQRPVLPSPSPLVTTEQIEVPVPDVTETYSDGADSAVEDGAEQLITEQIPIPSQLTASLTTAPSAITDPLLDEVPYPKQEVQTFAANSASSPCVMTPEAVPFLGKTVAMEVMTDESGQVVDTVTQESSQSVAYDELATCLVKNWDFEPAIAEGEPIATDGLMVRITIEANEAKG